MSSTVHTWHPACSFPSKPYIVPVTSGSSPYEPDDSCDIHRVDATSDSEEVDMEYDESDVNGILIVGSDVASETAMLAQSQSDSRVLRRSKRLSR